MFNLEELTFKELMKLHYDIGFELFYRYWGYILMIVLIFSLFIYFYNILSEEYHNESYL